MIIQVYDNKNKAASQQNPHFYNESVPQLVFISVWNS